MKWSLLLLILVGGYYFSRLNPTTAYSANRLSRDRLIFQSAAAGIVLSVVSYLAIRLLIAPTFPHFATEWNQRFPQPLSGTAAGAFLLGPAIGGILRFLCFCSSSFRYFLVGRHLRKWIRTQGSFLEKLLFERGDTGAPVQITLDNRKVYIGTVYYAPAEFESASTYLELQLYASGYREEDQLGLRINNRYVLLFNDLADEVAYLDKKLRRLRGMQSSIWCTWNSNRHERYKKIEEEYDRKSEEYRQILEQLKVEIPFSRIVSVMPYDEWIYETMDGLREDAPEANGSG